MEHSFHLSAPSASCPDMQLRNGVCELILLWAFCGNIPASMMVSVQCLAAGMHAFALLNGAPGDYAYIDEDQAA